jgi:protein-tyrosine kinase
VSLVEKALQKLQSSRQAQVPSGLHEVPFVVGTVERRDKVPAGASGPHVSLEPPRPSKIVRVNREALRAAKLIAPERESAEVADQFRAIKRPLIRRMAEGAGVQPPPQLLMLSSALPGDGKTFTSINLALSMALERNFAVLLVDADVAKPHVTRIFGAEQEPGLLDVLGDPSRPIESVILGTDIPSLSLLPAGKQISTATELLASERMREVATRLADLYQRGVVLLDTSPVLLTNEPRVLAPIMGQIVVVVKAGVTPQQALRDAVALLGAEGRISLILNEAPLSGPMGYYYGHRYGYGSSTSPTPPPPPPDR